MTQPPTLWLKIVQRITSTISSPDFIDTYRQRPQDFTRQCKLDFKTLCLFILSLPQAALGPELNRFFQMLYKSDLPQDVITSQAFCNAWKKIRPETFAELNRGRCQPHMDS